MMNIQANQVRRGDKVHTPAGDVTVTSFSHNWYEDFSGKDATHGDTVTLIGTLKGKNVRNTIPANAIVTVTR